MSVEVIQVETAAQLDRFIEYPNQLYKDDPNYVVPLKSERKAFFDFKRNPFYRTAKVKLFLAYRDRELVGRNAICLNYSHNEHHAEECGFFGFFDCEDDYETARSMLKVAMIELKRLGARKMRGPANFSTNHECGFLVDGFDSPPVVMMPYNYPYIPRLAERFGLRKTMDLLAYKMTRDKPFPERLTKLVERVKARSGVSLRPLNMKSFQHEVQLVRRVYNEAWQDNWGFVPMTEGEFNHMAKDLKQVVDPELVLIAEHEGRPIAFAMAVPDINQALIHLNGRLFPFGIIKLLWHTKIRNKIDGFRVITMGVVPEFQKRGVDAWMYHTLYTRGVEPGYNWAEFSWILETNDMMRKAAEQLGARVYKRYRMVEMPI